MPPRRDVDELKRNRVEAFMTLTLSDEEARTLRKMLQDYLPGLKFEVARSDARDIRHALALRQTLCERLLDELLSATTL